MCVCVCGVCVRHPPRRPTPSMVRTRSSVAAVVRQVVALSNNGKKIMLDYNLRTGFNSDLQNGPHRPQVYSRYASPHTSSAQTQPSTSPARASFHARLPSGQALDPALCGPRCTASPSLPSHTRARKLHPHTGLLLPYVTCPLLPRAPAPSDPRQHILPSALLTTAVCPLPVSAPSTTQHTPNLPSPACRFERRQPTFPRLCLPATDR